MNNVGSPTSSIESPLGPTQRQTHTSNDGDSESDNDLVEKPLIGSRVAVRRASAIHFGSIISCATLEGRNHYMIEYDDRKIVQVNTIELSILQQLYITQMNNDTIGQQKKKSQSTQDDEFVGNRVSFVCEGVVFYGTVKRCSVSDCRKKTWNVLYDNKDEEDIYLPIMLERQKHYVRHGKYDPTLPQIPPPQLPSSSTSTKKDSTRRTSTQQQPSTAKKKKAAQSKSKTKTRAKRQVSKKKIVKKKTKKTKKKKDETAVPKPKLHNADDETVATHGNYSPKVPYSYEVQYKDGSRPTYTPFVLKDQFRPKFKLPFGVNPTVDAMCKLSLPDSIIDGIVLRSNTYALARTKLEQFELVEGVIKKNPRWMHPSKYRDITRQDILYFFACYYYMGYCRLPARRDYWVQRKDHSCLPSH